MSPRGPDNENVVVTRDEKVIEHRDERDCLISTERRATVTYEADVTRTDETPTRNRVVYPRAVMERALREYQARIAAGNAFGIHVDRINGELERTGAIPLNRVSHRVTHAELHENTLRVRAETLQTERGKQLAALLHPVTRAALSVTGMGTLHPDGTVGDDAILISFDFVDKEIP